MYRFAHIVQQRSLLECGLILHRRRTHLAHLVKHTQAVRLISY